MLRKGLLRATRRLHNAHSLNFAPRLPHASSTCSQGVAANRWDLMGYRQDSSGFRCFSANTSELSKAAKTDSAKTTRRPRPRAVKARSNILGGATGVLAGTTMAKIRRVLQLAGATALFAGGVFAAYQLYQSGFTAEEIISSVADMGATPVEDHMDPIGREFTEDFLVVPQLSPDDQDGMEKEPIITVIMRVEGVFMQLVDQNIRGDQYRRIPGGDRFLRQLLDEFRGQVHLWVWSDAKMGVASDLAKLSLQLPGDQPTATNLIRRNQGMLMEYDCERPSFVGMQAAALSPAMLSFEHMFGDKNPVLPNSKLTKAVQAAQKRIERIRQQLQDIEDEEAAESERASRDAETDSEDEAARSAQRRARAKADRDARRIQLQAQLKQQEQLERQGPMQREQKPGEPKELKPVRWLQQVPRIAGSVVLVDTDPRSLDTNPFQTLLVPPLTVQEGARQEQLRQAAVVEATLQGRGAGASLSADGAGSGSGSDSLDAASDSLDRQAVQLQAQTAVGPDESPFEATLAFLRLFRKMYAAGEVKQPSQLLVKLQREYYDELSEDPVAMGRAIALETAEFEDRQQKRGASLQGVVRQGLQGAAAVAVGEAGRRIQGNQDRASLGGQRRKRSLVAEKMRRVAAREKAMMKRQMDEHMKAQEQAQKEMMAKVASGGGV